MRRDESKAVRATMGYQPSRKRPKGRPRNRWIDGVSQDSRTLDVEDWERVVQGRERQKAKTLR